MDLCGPIQNTAIDGYSYFLTITDDYSRKVNFYSFKEKRYVFKCFRSYQNRVERYLNSKIVSIRTDNCLEFCNSEFEVLLEEQGIQVESINTYTPEQNGVAERYNYTAMDCVKAMLNDSGLGNHFSVEALFCFTYVWNRICHDKQKLTPFELFCGNKPSVKHFKIFGAAAFLGVPKQQRRKLDIRAKKGIMVGYAQRNRGYRI
ncbi:Retrovirus-related Pol polyprotein from transposon TNT 1-94 [Araneus ventricosus]|uniref:Retrovirus-related Pol polyprotein from transposon TNT 1-94 n=1 Tax=Araneus ventricosus TaxID=182803 RepID=A0A4Y2U9Z6_ARAVE|nr:Retrovirus-related Pol polyprotein from transposon TNT 1-94 [Araneus ventricosus]